MKLILGIWDIFNDFPRKETLDLILEKKNMLKGHVILVASTGTTSLVLTHLAKSLQLIWR